MFQGCAAGYSKIEAALIDCGQETYSVEDVADVDNDKQPVAKRAKTDVGVKEKAEVQPGSAFRDVTLFSVIP